MATNGQTRDGMNWSKLFTMTVREIRRSVPRGRGFSKNIHDRSCLRKNHLRRNLRRPRSPKIATMRTGAVRLVVLTLTVWAVASLKAHADAAAFFAHKIAPVLRQR